MIRRLFWLGVGVAVGVLVVRKLTRAAESYSPSGIAASAQKSAAGMLDSVREFVSDVREGMAEREEQIYAALAENAEYADLEPDHLLRQVDEIAHAEDDFGENEDRPDRA